MRARSIRRWINKIRKVPLHPQWLVAVSGEERMLVAALAKFHGRIVDIGCADRCLAGVLPPGCTYVGLDYPDTALGLYQTRPDVFADARALPFPSGSIQGVIFKDVLEHVPGPEAALREVGRVLEVGGRLVLWMPFLYPIHDAPHDFQRYTEHGLREYLGRCGLKIVEIRPVLTPIETSALLGCLALGDSVEQILLRRQWLVPLLPVIACLVLLTNLSGKALFWLPASHFMPAFYRLVAVRDGTALT